MIAGPSGKSVYTQFKTLPLNSEMADFQAQITKNTVTDAFGTVIGLISVMPELDVVMTTFQYLFSSSKTSSWLVNVNCGSAQNYSYDYSYQIVNYNYDPSS